MEEYPWFLNIHIPHTPILIGEASDCGFASRVRQALLPDNKSHIPRLNYPSDEQLLSLSQGECPLPSPSRARMLLNIAFRHVSGYYCIVRKSEMIEGLKQMLQDPNSTGFFTKHRIWALLAIGELYSARSVNTGAGYPGILYFAKALKGLHIVSERPHIAAIETRLLLVSLCLRPPWPADELTLFLVVLLFGDQPTAFGVRVGRFRCAVLCRHGIASQRTDASSRR